MNYIKIVSFGEIIFTKEEIDKKDLLDVRDGDELIINLKDMTSFDPAANAWKKIGPIFSAEAVPVTAPKPARVP